MQIGDLIGDVALKDSQAASIGFAWQADREWSEDVAPVAAGVQKALVS